MYRSRRILIACGLSADPTESAVNCYARLGTELRTAMEHELESRTPSTTRRSSHSSTSPPQDLHRWRLAGDLDRRPEPDRPPTNKRDKFHRSLEVVPLESDTRSTGRRTYSWRSVEVIVFGGPDFHQSGVTIPMGRTRCPPTGCAAIADTTVRSTVKRARARARKPWSFTQATMETNSFRPRDESSFPYACS